MFAPSRVQVCRLLLLTLLFSTLACSQGVLTAEVVEDKLIFRSDGAIRYYVDYESRSIIVPGFHFSAPYPLLHYRFDVLEDQDGIRLNLTTPFRVALSPDQKTLTVIVGEAFGASPTQVGNDLRAPVIYYLSNAEPSHVAGLLGRLYSNLEIQIDDRQRALLVMVNQDDRVLVDELVATLDAPRPQIMFEAEILEINQNVTRSLGIEYDSIFSFSLAEGPGGDILKPAPFTRTPLSFSFGLNLLKVNGAAEVLARPRITTLDGVEAQIDATQTFPVVIGGSNGQQQSVQNITTGITMRMTPRVSPTGHVEADLSIRVSTPTGVTAQGVPQFSSREASTTVRVANGEPIAIGGLFEQRRIEGTSKVPILGDIPILGLLFRSTRTEIRETDLVIIVTPRVIGAESLPATAPPKP